MVALPMAEPERNLRGLLVEAGVPHAAAVLPDDLCVCGIAADSRRVRPGALFVAVRGAGADGNDFIAQAVSAGAAAVLTDAAPCAPAQGVPTIMVDDSRAALARVAAAFYGVGRRGRLPALVGVTGTNGKSTTCYLLRSILDAAGRRPALLGTVEYDLIEERLKSSLTTPDPVELCMYLARAAAAGADVAVLEVSSHALDQRRVEGLSFAVGVFTNLSGDHLDYHGNMNAYRAAKKRLFDALDEESRAVVNADDPASQEMARGCRAGVQWYGLEREDVDVWARIEEVSLDGSRFMLNGRSVTIPLVGRHNVANALAAAAAARALGVEWDHIVEGLTRVDRVPGRLQRVPTAGRDLTVFVDYAHTDDALGNVLRVLRPLTTGRLICVFGCGGDRDRSKRPRMAALAARHADIVIVTSDNPRGEDPSAIIEDILAGWPADGRNGVRVEPQRRDAIGQALASARAGDTVLIAGKGHEDYQIVGGRRLHFDDVEVVGSFLAAEPAVSP